MPDIVDLTKEPENQPEQQATQKQQLQERATQSVSQQMQTNAMNFFSTFVRRPAGLSFSEQLPNEEVLLFLRRHFITNLSWIVTTLILLVLPLGLPFVLQVLNLPPDLLPRRFGMMLLLFYYIIVAGLAFANFVSWFYNIGLVTTTRVLDIDFTELSSIHVAGTTLSDVEDISYQQSGFFASFFDYGTVEATTIAGKANFVFDRVPHPAQIVNFVSPLIGEK